MASSIEGTKLDSAKLIGIIHTVLLNAADYGLEAEVVATAMIYLKENPKATIEEALEVGLQDWDI